MEIWIAKTKVQSQWIQKHPIQIMKQAKRVWEGAILRGDGRAWIYFLFAVCQWLPTNERLYRKLTNCDEKVIAFYVQEEKRKQSIISLAAQRSPLLQNN